ncbi:MAG: maleylacetate reductase [Betaproteobacteria bacterium]|nr:maleylacetate reductase [Betaproteobacteria bacterium]
MKSGVFNFLALDRVHFGVTAAEALQQEIAQRASERVVIVTSRTLNRTTSVVTNLAQQLGDRVVGIFDECVEHTPRNSVIALAAVLRDARADLVVSLGGGTVIDSVKIALLCLAQGIDHADALDQWHLKVNPDGTLHVPIVGTPPCRQIAIPTTLSGAEFSDLGGATDTRTGIKHGFTGGFIGPVAVILDPAMTLHTPERLWLSTGIRAVDHAVEAICARNAQPFLDALGLRALKQLLQGRLDCQIGAWLAAMSIRRADYGASHGLGHALGADAGVPHGITSCVLLPTVMRYNADVCADALNEISAALGHPDQPAADLIEALIRRLGLPTRISELGVGRERLAVIAEKAMGNPFVRSNPRPIQTPAETLEILERAWA